jgi:hypothetical protein
VVEHARGPGERGEAGRGVANGQRPKRARRGGVARSGELEARRQHAPETCRPSGLRAFEAERHLGQAGRETDGGDDEAADGRDDDDQPAHPERDADGGGKAKGVVEQSEQERDGGRAGDDDGRPLEQELGLGPRAEATQSESDGRDRGSAGRSR